MPPATSLRLRHDHGDEAALAGAAAHAGERVGLAGVLGALDRQAALARVPGGDSEWGWTWEQRDVDDETWWPQGITSAAEPGPASPHAGQGLLLTTWYAKPVDGRHRGSRISVVDLGTLRYRHVLLVQPREDGSWFRPVRAHAGGLVWSGGHLLVAATRRGLLTARVDDVLRVHEPARFFGHAFVLPVSGLLRAQQDDGEEPLRYSFCSLERGGDESWLHVGEYGRAEMTRRLARFPLDPGTGLPRSTADGRCAAELLGEGPPRMQGVAVVEGRHHVSTSAGTWRPGSLHVGSPAAGWRSRHGVLPPGPEDLTWWPEQRLLWSLSEHPGRRYVYAVRPPR